LLSGVHFHAGIIDCQVDQMQSDGKSSEYEGEQEKETKDAVVEEHGEGED